MKKGFSISIILAIILFFSCETNKKSEVTIWDNQPSQVLTEEEVKKEIEKKIQMLKIFLNQNNLDGMLFTQVRNFYWITAGRMNNQIVLNKDIGAASALIMKDGKKYLICNGSESARLMDEGMKDLGYELLQYNWFESNSGKDVRGDLIKSVSKGIIGSDIDFPGTINLADKFKPLRFSLLDTEIKRYKWLGKQTTIAVEEVCKKIEPGMDEFQIEAITSAELRARGILPTVLLIAVDERIFNYRHGLPNGKKLENYAMINVVAEKWGMPIAVTRFVYFGEMPEELKSKFEKTAIVNSYFQQNTIIGKKMSDIFKECKTWYAKVGFENEWQLHHQGGAIGYDDREYVIYPGNENVAQVNQAFAWNPTITGAKVEDTFILTEDGFEVVTKTENWPMYEIILNGKKYLQPAVLLRDINSGEIIKEEIKQITVD
ncbi:MAG: M24 family metallopeptidase [Ignavibacteriales bacterium]|nr:M24 family metallopeptidase [Ignavibacteriales bacterium]